MSELKRIDQQQQKHLVSLKEGAFCYIRSAEEFLAIYFEAQSIPLNLVSTLKNWSKEKHNLVAKIICNSSHSKTLQTSLQQVNIEIEKIVTRESAFDINFDCSSQKIQVTKELSPSEDNTQSQILAEKYRNEKEDDLHQNKKVKVLIVDDSSTIRVLLNKIFSSDPLLEVVAMAESPMQVEGLIQKHKPDVITLDIHMPEMDGVTLLKKYLQKFPIPTVMISSISMEEGPMVLSALENGAVDYIQKPTMEQLKYVAPIMVEKIKIARSAKVNIKKNNFSAPITPQNVAIKDKETIVAIGSSTGGTEALRQVLSQMPNEIPPIVIVQHIPPVFSKAFADRLNSMFKFSVKEAEDGDSVLPNQVLIAPGGKQMKVLKSNGQFKIKITDDAPVNRHKPSVDYLFDSLAELKPPMIAAILTGMGADGAKGMKKLKAVGAQTIAQNEETCIVFGMPKEAIKQGCVDKIEPLDNIAPTMIRLLQKDNKKAS